MSLPTSIVFDQEIQDSFSIRTLEPYNPVDTAAWRLRYHRIFLIQQGVGRVHIDEHGFELVGNGVLLIAKGQVLAFADGSQLRGYEISFGDCFWEKAPASASNCKAVLFNNASVNHQLKLTPAEGEELNFLFRSLHGESEKETYPNKLDALAAYLKIIMIKLANIHVGMQRGVDDQEQQLYRRFIELVSLQYRSRHEVADFARQLHITARRLTELCRHCSGMGAKEIISGQLLAEAKRALLFSASPVKEIAYSLNFATPEQFSHFFKKHTQIAPDTFRKLYVNSGR